MSKRELTAREREVLALIADGLTDRGIANQLWISIETVKTHNQHLFKAIGAANRANAVAIAYRTGILSAGVATAEVVARKAPAAVRDLIVGRKSETIHDRMRRIRDADIRRTA